MTQPQIIFYTDKTSVFAHRVEIALQEVNADVTRYHVDLKNKPKWFTQKVNPVGKIPAIVYGGPKCAPEDPSPESFKLTESLVLLEFIADIFPDSQLLPKDPVLRAKVRLFIDVVVNKVVPAYRAYGARGEAPDALFTAFEELQALLPPGEGYAIGSNFTIADALFAPYIGRADLSLRNDIGNYAEGTGPKTHKEIFEGKRFSRLQKYYTDLTSRPSWKNSFDADITLSYLKTLTPLSRVK